MRQKCFWILPKRENYLLMLAMLPSLDPQSFQIKASETKNKRLKMPKIVFMLKEGKGFGDFTGAFTGNSTGGSNTMVIPVVIFFFGEPTSFSTSFSSAFYIPDSGVL